MELRIRVPRVPTGALSNLVGLAGLIAFAVAVGGLTGVWWWSLLILGVEAVALSALAQAHEAAAATPAATSAAAAAAARTADAPARPRLAATSPVAAARPA